MCRPRLQPARTRVTAPGATRGLRPRTRDDPDLLLSIARKNRAALDRALAEDDEIAKQIDGSLRAANQAQANRARIRTGLGSTTMQVLVLNG